MKSRESPSIRHELALWLVPALVLLLMVSAVGSYFVARRAVDLTYDHSMASVAADLSSFVKIHGRAFSLNLTPQAEEILRTDDADHIYFSVRSGGGEFIGGDPDLPATEVSDALSPVSRNVQFRDNLVRILAVVVHVDTTPIVVTVAETEHQRNQITWAIVASMVIVETLLAALSGVVVWIGIRRGLRPLRSLEHEVSRRTPDDMSVVSFENVPQEARGIVSALNDLLARLAQAHIEQQRFVADAAHQLRTPLARIQTQVDLLKNISSTELPAHTARLERSVGKTVRLANQLLSLARVEPHAGRPVVRHWIDLAEATRDQMEIWVHSALERNIDLGFELEPAMANVDAFLVHEAVSNLVDNALRYTPSGGMVTVSTGSKDGTAWVAVDDSGPGIPDRLRRQVFERFFRIPDSPGEGTGLGLAIVDAIVRAHSAEVIVADSSLGGTRIALQFAVSS